MRHKRGLILAVMTSWLRDVRGKFSQWLVPSGRAVSLIEVASELVE